MRYDHNFISFFHSLNLVPEDVACVRSSDSVNKRDRIPVEIEINPIRLYQNSISNQVSDEVLGRLVCPSGIEEGTDVRDVPTYRRSGSNGSSSTVKLIATDSIAGISIQFIC